MLDLMEARLHGSADAVYSKDNTELSRVLRVSGRKLAAQKWRLIVLRCSDSVL